MKIKCLGVGISSCSSGVYASNPLPSPERDIPALIDWLSSRGIGLDSNNTRLLMNERATTLDIVERLKWVSDADLCIFLFSGHGTRVADRNEDGEVGSVDNCLVTADFDWNNEHSWLIDDILSLHLSNCTVLGIIDACHSGTAYKALGKTKTLPMPIDIAWRLKGGRKYRKDVTSDKYAWLTACADNEVALDMGDLSLLTKTIVDSSGAFGDLKSVHNNSLALCKPYGQTPQLKGNFRFGDSNAGITDATIIDAVNSGTFNPATYVSNREGQAKALIAELKEQRRLEFWQLVQQSGFSAQEASDYLMKYL